MEVANQYLREPIAIIVAPNGARKTKHDHANLPMTKDELVAEAIACQTAGAAMIHLHARDANGRHSLDIDDNMAIYHAVKEAVGETMMVQLTTEAVGLYSPPQQRALVKAVKPEAASFALRELIPDRASEKEGHVFFHWLAENSIVSQIILYDTTDIERYFQLRDAGVLPKTYQHALVVLGRYHQTQQSSPWDLRGLNLARFDEEEIRCAICAFGAREQDCLASAMLLGFDVRVGFENNHFDVAGELAISNADQVEALRDVAHRFAIPLHSAQSLRSVLK
ncbi:TPA: 3-keto-5-aminohexanoate cleavage protein [Vibrio parahaemolyticus]|uniref:3-keto-5-aminohexanoate cleavage protein n=1 Tax=Vibrio parahaemolyticus TaxID=670 RepID=UPI0006B27179|nr:3-keto-5-aminohexanoate cleavage protein [Vibrio parahaemolyticus]EHH2453850.1 3-keto-5-aminohexanoate cleavage protein [Vibrio parahaemolyticus]KOY38778.1 class III aminotransferase [Vibrio parahaemolyticus]MBE4195020.1 3-keto-5-aminohexanoate cleavage protein [Vibrio parahaemolyticus]MCR9876510.1 3-keto-5-aminohexanoate cleavage protein [Vibrio parahaemolyticus]WMO23346.1 3-keto-5-aminohexanoate cleavage protein [Vibrio parahaemolyticus]